MISKYSDQREKIKEAGYDLTTMLIISEPINKDDKVEFSCINTVKKGQVIN